MSSNSGSRSKKENQALLLTGAIDVQNPAVPANAISDPEERLAQYLNSIGHAIDHYHLFNKIIFCENTGYSHDYASLFEQAKKKGKELEVLSFIGNQQVIQQRGKGYGEGETIEYALKNSTLLKDRPSFFKLTGRLIIKNLDRIAASADAENGFIWHPKEIYRRKSDHVETYFFKVSREFYTEYLLDGYRQVDEINHLYIEHIFFDRLKNLNLRAFKHPLQIIGNSGTSGKPYLETKNAILLERICCAIGAHHLRKNAIERRMTALFARLLKIRKT